MTAITVAKTIYVDATDGDDNAGVREDISRPFATVGAALTQAVAGDIVYLISGTYNPPAGLVIPSGVTVRGAAVGAVTIQMLGVSAATTLFTMGDNSFLEHVTLKLTSAVHATLTGILFPGATSGTAKANDVLLTVDNSGAPAVGSSDVTGVLIQSTGVPDRSFVNLRNSKVSVVSIAGGTKHGILVNTSAGNFNVRQTDAVVSGAVTGTAIAAEVNIAGGRLTLDGGSMNGTTSGAGTAADVSQTAGTLEVGGLDLVNMNANAKGFVQMLPVKVKEIELDFGATPTRFKTFSVADADVRAASIITAWQSGKAPTGRSADENEMDHIMFSANPGAGSFTLNAFALENPVVGLYKVVYLVLVG